MTPLHCKFNTTVRYSLSYIRHTPGGHRQSACARFSNNIVTKHISLSKHINVNLQYSGSSDQPMLNCNYNHRWVFCECTVEFGHYCTRTTTKCMTLRLFCNSTLKTNPVQPVQTSTFRRICFLRLQHSPIVSLKLISFSSLLHCIQLPDTFCPVQLTVHVTTVWTGARCLEKVSSFLGEEFWNFCVRINLISVKSALHLNGNTTSVYFRGFRLF